MRPFPAQINTCFFFACKLSIALSPVFALTVFSLPSSAAAASFYVYPSGSDSNPGTNETPFKTINKAASVVTAGDTVNVAPGTYSGLVTLNKSGTNTARIRFISITKWGAKLTDGIQISADYNDVQDFDVTGTATNAIIWIRGNYSRAMGNYVHNLNLGCTDFGGNGGAGILAEGKNYETIAQEIIGNVVLDIGIGPRDGTCRLVHGIYAAQPGVKVVNNLIARAIGDGITSWHAATNLTIINNTVVGNGGNGITIGAGETGAVTDNQNSFVANNIVYGNAIWGITEASDGTHKPNNNGYRGNLSYGNEHNGIGSGTWSQGGESGTINADPNFISATTDDYHLKATSPAIDNGSAYKAPSTDLDGNIRPQGVGYDIGAYEYSGKGGSIRNTNSRPSEERRTH